MFEAKHGEYMFFAWEHDKMGEERWTPNLLRNGEKVDT